MVKTVPNLVWYCIKVAGDKYVMLKVNVVFVFGTANVSHWVGGGWWVGCFGRVKEIFR